MRTLPAQWQRLSVLRQLTQSTSEEQWQAIASLPRLGTTVQIGRFYLKDRALVNRTLMRWIRGCPLMGGSSSSQPRPWSNVTGPLSCGRQALFHSQSGPMSGLPFSSVPSSPPTRFIPQLFRVLLLHRLWLALPLSSRTCRCGRPLDVLGYHRAACSRAGVLGSRGSPWRAQRHGSAVKPELGSPPISSSGIWTFPLPTMTPSFGGRCGRASVVRRSPIGHRYHVSFVGAGRRQTSPTELGLTGQPSPKPANANSARTRNSLGLRVARGWWYWPPRPLV